MGTADWFGFPKHTADGLVGNQAAADNLDAVGWHAPSFSLTFILLVLPGGHRAASPRTPATSRPSPR